VYGRWHGWRFRSCGLLPSLPFAEWIRQQPPIGHFTLDPINTKRHGNLSGKRSDRCLSKFLTPVKPEKDAYPYRKVGCWSSLEGKPRQLNRTPPLAYLPPGIFLVNLFSSPHPMSLLNPKRCTLGKRSACQVAPRIPRTDTRDAGSLLLIRGNVGMG
jgi:hypothetical protein